MGEENKVQRVVLTREPMLARVMGRKRRGFGEERFFSLS